MSSKTKKDIEIQKSFYEGAFLRRQAELKNPKIQKQTEELALRKSERATEKLKELKSPKKSAPQPSKKKPKDENIKMKNGVKP
jgi:hypothetical protein